MTSAQALAQTFAPRALRRSISVMLVIGTILNLINQGGVLFGGQPLIWWKLLLTYAVPFAVASYGSYAAFRQQ